MYFTDVTLRDGLQMEAQLIPLADKLSLFERIAALPIQRIEITSFVNPKWIPQFVDAEAFCAEVMKRAPLWKGKELMAFVPNRRGLDRLLAYDIGWVSAFVAVTETFNQKNVNSSIADTLKELSEVVRGAREKNRKVRLYVSTVFGCPYEGKMDLAATLKALKAVAALNPDEMALSDTIGVAVPSQIQAVLRGLAPLWDPAKTALHLHNTYDLAIAAAYTGYQEGIRSFDGSTGGIGGCPYAKGATGNVALEEMQYLFAREGAKASLDPDRLAAVTQELARLGVTVNSRLADILKKGGKLHAIH